MIVKGKNVGRASSTISVTGKVFADLINDIENSDLMSMDSIDLLTIINQGILPSNAAIKSIMVTEPFSEERKTSLEKIKVAIENGEDVTTSTSPEDEIPEDNEDGNSDDITITNTITEKKEVKKKENKKLAKLNLMKNLKSIDSSLVNAIGDEEAIEVLMANKMRKLWEGIINNDITVDDIISESENSGKFYKILVSRFVDEYEKVCNYEAPYGFDAHKIKNGKKIYLYPNLMQKLMVYRTKKNHYYGNWSGMGSGKTLSAIIASRELQSHLTVIVGINSTMAQWGKDILNAYPESTGTRVYLVKDKHYDDIEFDMTKYNYVLIPYSRFSQRNEEPRLKFIADNKVDFIVIDEVHKAKKRGEDSEETTRRERLVKLINWAKDVNPSLYKMVMSGTPIINELSEAKSLLTLLTGLKFADIKTNRTLSNALKLHQMLLIHGLRFVPKYDQELQILTSDNTPSLRINGDKYLNMLKGIKSIDTEKLFVEDKLNAIEPYLKKGVLIYSHYTTDFIQPIREFVESKGFTTALYSDNRDSRDFELERFRSGDAEIMIASDPVNTGVDRLQEVCDTMILITLPWTNADFEQLKGRIYRQGMDKDAIVKIIIPQVIVKDADGKNWSWDKQRYEVIKSKKSLADCVIDGVIPATQFPTRETLYRKSVEGLKIWRERVASNDFLVREDSGIPINLDVITEDEKRIQISSFISNFNNKGKRTEHSKLHKALTENPSEWHEYHRLRRETMKEWEEIPYEYIATKIKNKRQIVGDFGCGDNQMKIHIPYNKVYSFDHIACDDTVTACDMAHTPLEDESIDIAVFSLALWGCNYEDYFKEAYRVLTFDGLMYIAEPSSSYTDNEKMELINILRRNGFTIVMHGNNMWENRGKFFYINAIKK
jgi:superfamily II DNA or RNA helicase